MGGLGSLGAMFASCIEFDEGVTRLSEQSRRAGQGSNLHPLGLESNARPVELPALRGTEGIRTPNLRFRRPLL